MILSRWSLASYAFDSLMPGVHLIVLGAVHGNETCGAQATRQVITEMEEAVRTPVAGKVTFVPVANPKAFAQGTRDGERNLNRDLRLYPNPSNYEDYVANILCPMLDAHDVLLDIHSFTSTGEPFVFLGPENNSGDLQPFRRAEEELQFAMSLGVDRMVYGWFDAYSRFVSVQNTFWDNVHSRLNIAKRLATDSGRGTTEYIRSVGGYGVTVECGSHDDPEAPNVAYRAIVNAMTAVGILGDGRAGPKPFRQSVNVVEIYLKQSNEDSLDAVWTPFSKVAKNEILGRRGNGEMVLAPTDGYIVFAHPHATIGEDWIHFGVDSRRGKI